MGVPMKLLIISDTHGNVDSLRAVWEKESDADCIIFAGDMVDFGFNPKETVDWFIDHRDILFAVLGNHDEAILKNRPAVVDRTKKPGTRIPPRRKRAVVKLHTDLVLARNRRQFDLEGIVPVLPLADKSSIAEDLRLAHRPIKDQRCPSDIFRQYDCAPVFALTWPGQRTRATDLHALSDFPILDYGRDLLVVFGIERTRNGPVMRHCHRFPYLAI